MIQEKYNMWKGKYSSLYKIPIYIMDLKEMDIKGTNKFWDIILDIAIWFDVNIIRVKGFDILVGEKID